MCRKRYNATALLIDISAVHPFNPTFHIDTRSARQNVRPTISDIHDTIEDVVRSGWIGNLRDSQSAQRSIQQMGSNSHDDFLGFRSLLVLGDVDLMFDGADDALVQTLRSTRRLLDTVTRKFLQPIL